MKFTPWQFRQCQGLILATLTPAPRTPTEGHIHAAARIVPTQNLYLDHRNPMMRCFFCVQGHTKYWDVFQAVWWDLKSSQNMFLYDQNQNIHFKWRKSDELWSSFMQMSSRGGSASYNIKRDKIAAHHNIFLALFDSGTPISFWAPITLNHSISLSLSLTFCALITALCDWL